MEVTPSFATPKTSILATLHPYQPPPESQATILQIPNEKSVQLPVGIGITPIIWSTYPQDGQKAIATSFNCDTIRQFEDEFLKTGRALVESELSVSPPIDSDHAIAEALASNDPNDLASSESDDIIAESIAAEEHAIAEVLASNNPNDLASTESDAITVESIAAEEAVPEQ